VTVTAVPSFEVVAGWEQLPAGYAHPDVADVSVDSTGRVYLFCRSEHPDPEAPPLAPDAPLGNGRLSACLVARTTIEKGRSAGAARSRAVPAAAPVDQP
jgi:hypothetical protein